ncbi:MAG: glycosyltransferase [Planctomycetota bacterium]
MLTIAFDGACLGDGPPTGVSRAFLDALAAYVARGQHRVLLLLPPGAEHHAIDGVEVVPAPRGALRRQLVLPQLLRRVRADVLHSPVAAVPLRAPCATIATVHDLPWLHAEAGESSSWWRRFATRRSLGAADAVIAPSTMTRDDARQLLDSGQDKVRLVLHGTALPLHAELLPPERRDGPLLVLGDDRPRKNRQRLREAHARALAGGAHLPELAFVGPPERYVDEAEKRDLLRTCRALVHVSRFEGFGLPVLEGLAFAAPVLCSDLPPHRAVAADAALFVDADDTDAIAAGLVRISNDDALRRELAASGPVRAAAFPIDAVAAAWARLHVEVTQ